MLQQGQLQRQMEQPRGDTVKKKTVQENEKRPSHFKGASSLDRTELEIQSSAPDGDRSYLTQCIHQLVLESQLPHKTVNLMFELVTVNNKLTICGGVDDQ